LGGKKTAKNLANHLFLTGLFFMFALPFDDLDSGDRNQGLRKSPS